MTPLASTTARRRVSTLLFVGLVIAAAIVIGTFAGALFARQQMLSAPRAALRPEPGEFVPPGPRPVGVPSTAVPIPAVSAPLAIGFLDVRRNVALPRSVVKAKVGDCLVARAMPKSGSAYRRLVGGERWTIGGRPSVQVRPGDAPGYCVSWNRPSDKRGYALVASAVVADDAGTVASANASARVIVVGTPKPQPAASPKLVKHGRPKPQPRGRSSDQ